MPKALRGRRIFSLDLLNLSAGTSMRGEFEKRMKEIIAYLQRHKNDVILFVDEIHTLVGAGKTAGSSDATQILKVPLARGEIVYVVRHDQEPQELRVENTSCSFRAESCELDGNASPCLLFVCCCRLIGATTLEEYKLHIEKDAAFCRRFQNIVLEAPQKDKAICMSG